MEREAQNTLAALGVILIILFGAFLLFGSGGPIFNIPDLSIRGGEQAADVSSSVAGSVPSRTLATAAMPHDAEGHVVRYTDQGFIPFVIVVKKGASVRFINESDQALRVTSHFHPTATEQFYPEFNASRSIGHGEEFSLSFTQVGAWGYKNLNNEAHLGAVVVME